MKKTPFRLQVRHFTALISGFIYNLNFFGLSARNVCAPGFNCHGCPWATFSCPVGIIGYGFGIRTIPAFALGSVLAIALMLGRLVCGYACPVGLAQELVYRIPGRKFKIPRFFRYFKYVILFLTVFALTFIFGFKPDNAYIMVSKPEINKYPATSAPVTAGFGALGSLNKPGLNNLANDAKGGHEKTFCPVPQEILNGTHNKDSLGTRPAVKPAFGLAIKSLDIPEDKPSTKSDAVNSLQQTSKLTTGGSANNFSNIKPLNISGLPVTGQGKPSTDTPPAEPEPFSPDITQKTKLLKVDITVENISQKPLEGFELSAAYYSSEGELVWEAGTNRKFNVTLKPDESYKVPAFLVPDKLSKGGLVITSPQSNVSLDYWPLFCTYCPVAVFEADLPSRLSSGVDLTQMFYQTTTMNLPRLFITLFIVLACVFVSRFFCRVICPLGAMYALFSRFSILRIEVSDPFCVSCAHCNSVCPVELDVATEAGGPECIACGNCISKCPSSAITRRFSLK